MAMAAGSKHRRGSLQHSVRRVAVVSCLWPGTGETRSAVSANFRGGALSPWRRPQSSVAPSNIKAKQQFLPQILLAPSETESCAVVLLTSFTSALFAPVVPVVAPCIPRLFYLKHSTPCRRRRRRRPRRRLPKPIPTLPLDASPPPPPCHVPEQQSYSNIVAGNRVQPTAPTAPSTRVPESACPRCTWPS